MVTTGKVFMYTLLASALILSQTTLHSADEVSQPAEYTATSPAPKKRSGSVKRSEATPSSSSGTSCRPRQKKRRDGLSRRLDLDSGTALPTSPEDILRANLILYQAFCDQSGIRNATALTHDDVSLHGQQVLAQKEDVGWVDQYRDWYPRFIAYTAAKIDMLQKVITEDWRTRTENNRRIAEMEALNRALGQALFTSRSHTES